MKIKDENLVKGEIADYHFNENGILYSFSKSPKRTVKNITENIALVKEITKGKIVPLLIYLCDLPIPDKEARKFSTQQLPNVYKAMAMVSKPGLSKFIMNILFSLKKPLIPMKSFTDEKKAEEWLKQFL
ncbi:STAS/SEC14 domain-containing protein [Pedobacter sp. SD-b]|uniref:STAS/SEC14 domain-containing protein n=1 Tax=Pedobacter segetis TaxID=2793069 RepID=A0ABS1BLU5_9SPHI|nr:STAS/SEC14 domain-containing protein [Pedobacter segetis]MBK0383867.1 STAS/SEC14 domain-containing protein [Pedobacter segetis]